jgi:hypothetical protein
MNTSPQPQPQPMNTSPQPQPQPSPQPQPQPSPQPQMNLKRDRDMGQIYHQTTKDDTKRHKYFHEGQLDNETTGKNLLFQMAPPPQPMNINPINPIEEQFMRTMPKEVYIKGLAPFLPKESIQSLETNPNISHRDKAYVPGTKQYKQRVTHLEATKPQNTRYVRPPVIPRNVERFAGLHDIEESNIGHHLDWIFEPGRSDDPNWKASTENTDDDFASGYAGRRASRDFSHPHWEKWLPKGKEAETGFQASGPTGYTGEPGAWPDYANYMAHDRLLEMIPSPKRSRINFVDSKPQHPDAEKRGTIYGPREW